MKILKLTKYLTIIALAIHIAIAAIRAIPLGGDPIPPEQDEDPF